MRRCTMTIVAMVVGLVGAAPLAAQEQQPVPQQQAPSPEQQQLMAEARQIQTRLAQVQTEVLADPELKERQEEIGSRIETAMIEADPGLEDSMARVQELQQQMAQAQQAGNTAQLQQMVAEARQIESRYQQAQAQALEDPDLAQSVEAFNERVRERMLEVEPETEQLIERLQTLQQQLQASMQP